MKPFLAKLINRGTDLCTTEPLLAFFLAGALLAVFLSGIRQRRITPTTSASSGLLLPVCEYLGRLVWALALTASLAGTLGILRAYLHQTVSRFQHDHGRITEANYHAVQTIWGAEQVQRELRVDLFYDEETIERIESEDLTKPAILRKKTVRHFIRDNPFVWARHEVVLRQSLRKKGSAVYGGYETACRFAWRLQNRSDHEVKGHLIFPLPAAAAMYDGLVARLNEEDVLAQMQLTEDSLLLARDVKPGEVLDLQIAFKSRGMSLWYLQVREPREIRDFTLNLYLPELAKTRLNYPEGCMSPTDIKTAADGRGSILTYRLDHAISNKGMGVSLPKLPQPGATTTAVLNQAERGWMLIFALLIVGLTLAGANHAALLSICFGAGTAFTYGLLGDFSDLLFGFWGTALVVLLPLFLLLTWLLTRVLPGIRGKLLALQLPLYGLLYPSLAGLDAERETLYLNLCALMFLAYTAWLLVAKLGHPAPAQASQNLTEEPSTG